MKLYRFTLSTWRGVKIHKNVLEVEEKPKTYIEKGEYSRSRILKSDVGVLSGYDRCTLYLLEDDMKKAKSMFIESLKKKIEIEKQRIENITESCNREITEYENGIAELLKGEEG